jgi:hypothetical protein
MASYTMELREIVEMYSQDTEVMSARDRIEIGRKKLFDFEYPIFDPLYKGVFETNFIRTFYMREIGFETEGLFKFQLETWLLINMPYFNKMFQSELIDFDPLVNSKMSTNSSKNKDIDGTIGKTKSVESNKALNSDNFNRRLENDTPDSRLAITTADGSGVIEYASNITEDKGNSSANSTDNVDVTDDTTSDITELETYVQTVEGKMGSQSYSKMMTEYRESLVRVENKMFKEMNQLFMLVY